MKELILSIETATSVCSVALHAHDGIVAATELHIQKSHAEQLTILIESLFKQGNLAMSELVAVAVSEGPGSYTGLRIGVSVAKSLCYTLDVPLIAVSTLEAMAAEWASKLKGIAPSWICPMLDARRMEVYAAVYDESLNCLLPATPMIIEKGVLAKYDESRQLLLVGNGAFKCKGMVERPHLLIDSSTYPSAYWIGQLARGRFEREEFESVAYFEPKYLKPFQGVKPKRDKLLNPTKK